MAQPLQDETPNKEILEKIHLNVVTPHIGHEYFESEEYLNSIPKNDANWIFCELDIKSDEYNPSNLDNFVPPDYDPNHSDVGHPYISDVISGLDLFKEWRNFKHTKNKNDQNAWKYLKTVNNELKAYWTYIPNEAISAVKSEMIIPYSVPIITGIISNDKHCCNYNKNIDQELQLQNLNAFNLIWYCNVKKPMAFITPRDMLTVRFIYILPDCEVIVGEKSIDSHPKDKWKNDNNYVRAHITLNLWHIRPYYKGNKNKQSFVTYYTHFRPNGAIPQWLVDQKVGEKAENPLTVKKYIDSIKGKLHEPGILHIPYPLMKMIKISSNKEQEDKGNQEENKDNNDNMNDNVVAVDEQNI